MSGATQPGSASRLVPPKWNAPRWLVWLCRRLVFGLFRVRVQGAEHLPDLSGRILLVANHASLLDGLFLYLLLPRPPVFVINANIARQVRFRFFLNFVRHILTRPQDPAALKAMIRCIEREPEILLLIFPEGRITTTGSLMKVQGGPAMIAERCECRLLPIAIGGTQYSPFSYTKGILPQRWLPRVRLTVLPPRKIVDAGPAIPGQRRQVQRRLEALMRHVGYLSFLERQDLYSAFLHAACLHGMDHRVLSGSDGDTLDYRGILARTFALGGALQDLVADEPRVGLLLPNVPATPVAFLALQYLGRVPVMLNYSVGAQACLQACETASLRTVLTSRRFVEAAGLEELAERLADRCRVTYLEDLGSRISRSARWRAGLRSLYPRLHLRLRGKRPQPEEPAVILMTSGSEGRPKGVALSHANLAANYAQVRCLYDINRRDLLFCCLPLFHCFGLSVGLLLPLLAGSRVLLYPNPLHYRQIPDAIYDCRATILLSTNTFLQGYARYAHPFYLHSLRYVLAGAEKLTEQTIRLWQERFGITIMQGYGATETSPIIAVNTPIDHKRESVGLPIPAMECLVEPLAALPEGGRLLVRGPNAMLGYLQPGRPDVIDPPSDGPGGDWYDTGDIARLDEDGYLFLLGRQKRFAKIGGEMISLTVVEELAAQCWPDDRHACISLPDPKRGERIVLLTERREAAAAELRRTVRAAGYSELYAPSRVLPIKELPILATGKPDYPRVLALAKESA